ncbi:MAG TPA: hypothetical protein VMP11_01150 [Verrucomicrobiae bacterium]|nr:hypothetical protein [Verrucomicrobiae bacterium]
MKYQLMRNLLRWGARLILALLALLALFILEENIRGHILLARYKAQLRAQGEKLTLAELNLPEPMKSVSGGYALPMMSNEFVAVYRTSPLVRYGLGVELFIASGRREVLHQQARLRDHRPQPAPSLPPAGGRHDRAEGRGAYVPSSPQTCSWDELSKDIAAVSNVLERARTAATGSAAAAELDYKRDLGPQLTPLIQTLRLASWFSASALDALHRGDLGSALDDIVVAVNVAGLGKGVRNARLQDLRVLSYETNLGTTWEALQTGGWIEPQLARLQQSWQRAACLPEYVLTFEMERIECLRSYDHPTPEDVAWIWREPKYYQFDWADLIAYACAHLGFTSFSSADLDFRVENGLKDWTASAMSRVHWLIWRAAWVQQDEVHALRGWQDDLDGVRTILARESWTAWPVRPLTQWTLYDQLRYLTPERAYYYDDSFLRAAEYETLREMTIAAIALKRYQLRTSRYPTDLSALVPEFLPEKPRDWMNGESLHYRLNADGTFTLYSVGENGVDDGGDPTLLAPRRLISSIWDGRDAVWPTAAPPTDPQTN